MSADELSDEHALVDAVVRDYIEGWYTADSERMARALHPDMVKRYVDALPGGREVVHSVTRDLMIEMTRGGGGSKTRVERRNIAVDVFEVSGDIAAARASSSEYLEYLSLARCNGRWTIVNILWRFQTPPASPSRG
jgi:alkyl sulfatase BDS1-like metallo-beta-lactamase superfamily hydrolase